jgi:hypothetical protein
MRSGKVLMNTQSAVGALAALHTPHQHRAEHHCWPDVAASTAPTPDESGSPR